MSRYRTMPPVVVTPPSVEPVTVAEAKAHLRITAPDDDTYLGSLITVARLYVEQTCGLALITQTLDVGLEQFPCSDVLPLPVGPVASVTSVTSYNTADSGAVMTGTYYRLDTTAQPPRIVLDTGVSWPTDVRDRNAGVVRIVAGYGASGASVPQPIRQALLLLVAHWYEHREPVEAAGLSAVPMTVDALLACYRQTAGIA